MGRIRQLLRDVLVIAVVLGTVILWSMFHMASVGFGAMRR